MMRMNARTMRFRRMLAWIVLALFALAFLEFFGHFGCCHPHDAMDDVCPFCEAFIQYTRLLRMAGLMGLTYILLNCLRASGMGLSARRPGSFLKNTLVSLRVKLSD